MGLFWNCWSNLFLTSVTVWSLLVELILNFLTTLLNSRTFPEIALNYVLTIFKLFVTKKIQIFSPATLANLGPGFDTIGLAVDIWNIFEFEFDTENFNIQIQGEGEKILPNDSSNLVYKSFSLPSVYFTDNGLPILFVNLSYSFSGVELCLNVYVSFFPFSKI